jgi:hypothetical protein
MLVGARLSRNFERYVTLGFAAALGDQAPPFADKTAAISAIAKSEVAWTNSLTNVVLSSSADLRVATTAQANSATRALYLTCLFMLLFVLGAIGSVLVFSWAVRRPLAVLYVAKASGRGQVRWSGRTSQPG